MKKQSKKTKNIIFFSFFLILSLGMGTFVLAISPLSPFVVDEGSMYITSGDVIRNFKLESFNDEAISSSGTVISNGQKLKFELGEAWTANPEDLDMQYVSQVGEEVYMYYKVAFTNKMNIYTNVRLDDAVADGVSLDATTESFNAGFYHHYGCYGGDPHIAWSSNLNWNHLELGNIRDHNADVNKFEGGIEMSFDIDQSPLPNTLTDENGQPATKNFDYIAVSTVSVAGSTHGLLSNDVPETVGLTPAEYETSRSVTSGGGARGGIAGSLSSKWNPSSSLGDLTILDTFDLGTQGQSAGSSMNPTTKTGGSIWDAKSEKSMNDCKFTYNLGALSPLVQEYGQTMSYYQQTLKTQDFLASLIPWVWSVKVVQDTDTARSETRSTALHVTNRYIQVEMKVVFNIWSSYSVETLDEDPYDGLERPQEYYDQLVWDSTVDGFGGAQQYQETTSFSLVDFNALFGGSLGIIIALIVVAVIGVGGYIAYKRYKRVRQFTGAIPRQTQAGQQFRPQQKQQPQY